MVKKSKNIDHITVVKIHDNDFNDEQISTISKNPEKSLLYKARQRQEALHIVDDEQFEAFLIAQGCKIQNGDFNSTICDDFSDSCSTSSKEESDENDSNVIYENLKPFCKLKRTTAEEIALLNQNVGVSGTVCMLSDPITSPLSNVPDVILENVSGPYSLMSVEQKVSKDELYPKHSTTIIIGEKYIKRDGRVYLTVSGEEVDCNEIEPIDKTSKNVSQYIDNERQSLNSKDSEDINDHHVFLKWRIIPPQHSKDNNSPRRRPTQHDVNIQTDDETDRGSTPSSFSSAYTVTEKGISSRGSISTRRTNSLSEESNIHSDAESWSDESGHFERTETDSQRDSSHSDELSVDVEEVKETKDGSYSSYRQEIEISIADIELPPWEPKINSDILQACDDEFSCAGSVKSDISDISGASSIIHNYIPSRDQREREDEELWVSNEAAYPNGIESEYTQSISELPPPLIPPSWWGERQGSPTPVSPVPVLGQTQLSTDASFIEVYRMAALICPLTAQKKHFTNRQRSVENNSNSTITDRVKDQSANISINDDKENENNTNSMNNSDDNLFSKPTTPSLTNKPTKRFSFLIRSNSLKKEENDNKIKENATPVRSQSITPSDRAILDRLAELNLEEPFSPRKNVPTKNKTDNSNSKSVWPPCVRCRGPVYPPERIQANPGSLFHTTCFKCNTCGVKLTLKTFCKNPQKSDDCRIFCRSHVPSLRPTAPMVSKYILFHISINENPNTILEYINKNYKLFIFKKVKKNHLYDMTKMRKEVCELHVVHIAGNELIKFIFHVIMTINYCRLIL